MRADQITVNMQKRKHWAGRGLGVVGGKGHSHPRRATRGAPVCTCPGPLPLAQPVCGERAPARAPGSCVRFFVPAHARPILTDRVRGPLAANHCRSFYLLPPPRSPARAAPFPAHVVSASSPGQLLSSGRSLVWPPSPILGAWKWLLPLVLPAARGCPLRDCCGAVGSPGRCWGRSRLRPPPSLLVGRFT